jgi:hypothetical protein
LGIGYVLDLERPIPAQNSSNVQFKRVKIAEHAGDGLRTLRKGMSKRPENELIETKGLSGSAYTVALSGWSEGPRNGLKREISAFKTPSPSIS